MSVAKLKNMDNGRARNSPKWQAGVHHILQDFIKCLEEEGKMICLL